MIAPTSPLPNSCSRVRQSPKRSLISAMVDRECPVCRVTYLADPKRLKHGRQTTCSRKCSYARRAKLLNNSVIEPCGVCGTATSRSPAQAAKSKADVPFCSRACHYKARSLGLVSREVTRPYDIPQETRDKMARRLRQQNAERKARGEYGHSEATKEKISATLRKRFRLGGRATGKPRRKHRRSRIRKYPTIKAWRDAQSIAMAKAIAEGRIPRVSKLEGLVGEALKTLGVAALPQHMLRHPNGRIAAVIDFYLPDLNIALEVNGTFWHADPREYPNGPIYASQKRTARKYANKRELLQQRGIRLVEVWETEVRADAVSAVKTILPIG